MSIFLTWRFRLWLLHYCRTVAEQCQIRMLGLVSCILILHHGSLYHTPQPRTASTTSQTLFRLSDEVQNESETPTYPRLARLLVSLKVDRSRSTYILKLPRAMCDS